MKSLLNDVLEEFLDLLVMVLLVILADIVWQNLFGFLYCGFWTFIALVAIPWADRKLYPENYGLCSL